MGCEHKKSTELKRNNRGLFPPPHVGSAFITEDEAETNVDEADNQSETSLPTKDLAVMPFFHTYITYSPFSFLLVATF